VAGPVPVRGLGELAATDFAAAGSPEGKAWITGQPWVAIDPAAAGTPERSAAELLWTRADELPGPGAITGLLDTIVVNGQLDRAKAVAWSFARTVDYWLWGLENGLTVDPLRCRRIASALAPMADRLPSLTARIEGSVRCWPDHRRGQGGSI
jgi:hypothetical protein